jgi:hypothetical protein
MRWLLALTLFVCLPAYASQPEFYSNYWTGANVSSVPISGKGVSTNVAVVSVEVPTLAKGSVIEVTGKCQVTHEGDYTTMVAERVVVGSSKTSTTGEILNPNYGANLLYGKATSNTVRTHHLPIPISVAYKFWSDPPGKWVNFVIYSATTSSARKSTDKLTVDRSLCKMDVLHWPS